MTTDTRQEDEQGTTTSPPTAMTHGTKAGATMSDRKTDTTMTDPVDTDAHFSDRAKRAATQLRAKAERNIATGKHDGRTKSHGPACEGCQILGLMADVDRLRAAIENAPHEPDCLTHWNAPEYDVKPCTCWKASAL